MSDVPETPTRTPVEPPFVGRDDQLELFRSSFARMLDGSLQILTIRGEPGIGKTRCAESFGRIAEDRGASVLWGHCHEEPGAPPYWPWTQILREFIAASTQSEFRMLMGSEMEAIGAVVPELAAPVEQRTQFTTVAPAEPGHARFRVFAAIGEFLAKASASLPLVLVIDNLHRADPASLALLEFLTQQLTNCRIVLVGTYRDTDVARGSAFINTLGIWSRHPGLTSTQLRGLSKTEIATLGAAFLQSDLPESITDAIDSQTDGNPLFVIEMLRVLAEEIRVGGGKSIEIRIPEGIREAIGHRLSRLSGSCNELLAVASVVGRSFRSRELSSISGIDIEPLVQILDEAQQAGVIETQGYIPGEYRFTHVLIRETLYDDLPSLKRMQLHARAGGYLLELHSGNRRRLAGRIAHHFCEAVTLGHEKQAIEASILAIEQALSIDAHEDAIAHADQALRVLEFLEANDERYMKVLLFKAESLRRIADFKAAVEVLTQAITEHSYHQSPQLFAEMAILLVYSSSNRPQRQHLSMLTNALAETPPDRPAERARLLSALAFAERTADQPIERIEQLIEESLTIAERLGDAYLTSDCVRLSLLALRSDPRTLRKRHALSEKLLTLAFSLNVNEIIAEAYNCVLLCLLESGQVDEFADLLKRANAHKGAVIGVHAYRFENLAIVLALMRGEYEGLEERMDQHMQNGRRLRSTDADGVYGSQMFALNRDLGQLEPHRPLIDRLTSDPDARTWTPGLVVALCELEMYDAARIELERLAANEFAALPDDDTRQTCLIYGAEACYALGDAERASQLYEMLSPYAGLLACQSVALCFGAVDLYLGMLAATHEKLDRACEHFERAREIHDRSRAWPFLARTLYCYGSLLFAREDIETRKRGAAMLGDAEQLAGRLGMQSLAKRIARESQAVESPTEYPDQLTPREVEVLRLIAIGRSNKDISNVLSISLNTVATHVRHILEKTHCANRTEAAAYAVQFKLIRND